MSSPLIRSTVEDFLAQQTTTKHRTRGRLIFALDATASRQETWDHAVKLQADMFREVATIGKLDVQLLYFRGIQGVDGECRASSWVNDALQLARLMNHVTCRAGHTQITRVLQHALRETTIGQPGERTLLRRRHVRGRPGRAHASSPGTGTAERPRVLVSRRPQPRCQEGVSRHRQAHEWRLRSLQRRLRQSTG
jgi:hypothetical protein